MYFLPLSVTFMVYFNEVLFVLSFKTLALVFTESFSSKTSIYSLCE